MATIWKKAVEAVEVGPDTGDILAPLKRIREQYRKKSEDGTNPSWMFYLQQATNVERLIKQ
jgi:hypothetical protein